MIAVHAAVLAPERVEALVLSDPYFPASRHLEDVSRWGHWQNFRQEAEEAGVFLSSENWYDLTTFFDQVLHLDDERLLRFRQAVGLPALKRVLRLAGTTCGDDSKLDGRADGRGDRRRAPSLPGPLRGELPVPGHGRLPGRPLAGLPGRRISGAQHRAPEENPEAFVAAVREFLESSPPAEACEVCAMSERPPSS